MYSVSNPNLKRELLLFLLGKESLGVVGVSIKLALLILFPKGKGPLKGPSC